MATNKTRMRVSYQQEDILRWLAKGKPVMAAEMAFVGIYEARLHKWTAFEDLTAQTKSVKRALRRLEHWGLARVFTAPHKDRDTDFWEVMRERMRHFSIGTNELEWQFTGDKRLSDRDVRAYNHYKSPVPRGNRQLDAVWAEITDAGREWLRASEAAA